MVERLLTKVATLSEPLDMGVYNRKLIFCNFCNNTSFYDTTIDTTIAFSALMLLVGHQEKHPACKKIE